MNSKWLIFALLATVMILYLGIFYIGFVRSYMDEDMQITFFVKKLPTIQIEFFDPFANEGDDLDVNNLSPGAREQFNDYCKYRFGIVENNVASLEGCRNLIPPYLK